MISMSEQQETPETVADETRGDAERHPAAEQANPDPVLLASRDLARAALGEITDPQSIGADDGHEVHDERTVTLFFECRLSGYPGWRWAAALARVSPDAPVTVLEVELLPGDGAVLAPEWVPWSERLAQFRDAQARQAAEEASAADEAAKELADLDDADDDPMENDFSDYDDDIDGADLDDDFDIDDLDESADHDEDDEDLDDADEASEEE